MNPMMLFTIARYGAALAAGFWLAWTLQGHQLDKIKLERKDEIITQQRATRAALERATNTALAAQNNATDRAVALRRSSELAATELDRLRESTASAVRAAQTDAATCAVATTTLAGLFDQCGTELQGLAAKADRHVSDIKLMKESWPQ